MEHEVIDKNVPAPARAHDARWFWVLLACTFISALGVRLYHLDHESLWYDELTQVMTYHLPVSYVVPAAAGHGQPPLDYLIGVALQRAGVAADDWWVRLPAAVFGAVSVLLAGVLVRRIAGSVAGLTAAALLTLCPLHVVMSQEARPYTIFVCFSLAAVLSFDHARKRHTPCAWALVAACTWAMLMSRWVGPNFITLGLGLYACGAWLASRRSTCDTLRRRESTKLWAACTAILFAYALYGPVLGLILDRAGRAVTSAQTAWLPRVGDQLAQAYRAVLAGYSTSTLYSGLPVPAWLLATTGLLVAAGILVTWRTARCRRTATLLLAILLPFPLVYAAVYAKLTPVHAKPQYLLLMAVPVLSLIAIALDRIRTAAPWRRPIGRWAVYALGLAAVAGPMARSSWNLLNTLDKRNWRDAMSFLVTHAREGDAFAVIAADTVPASYHPAVGGKGRYGLGWARFESIDLETTREDLDGDVWTQEGNTVWIVGVKDRLYEGREQLPAPTNLPEHAVIHDTHGVFVVGVSGPGPALTRLGDGLGAIVDNLPHGSGVVAPHLFRGRLLLAQGQFAEAHTAFSEALQQCRTPQEAAILSDRYMSPKTGEMAFSKASNP